VVRRDEQLLHLLAEVEDRDDVRASEDSRPTRLAREAPTRLGLTKPVFSGSTATSRIAPGIPRQKDGRDAARPEMG